ncbi:hypothetical protein T492DRAFT_885771 [Pavlovales sp. CCMP2436]|nr:hypothetical protein T492DRAFT_885771 [Pavlovales sp. CCMP2436]
MGLGGLGGMGVKLAKALGAHVTVISRSETKRAMAMKTKRAMAIKVSLQTLS